MTIISLYGIFSGDVCLYVGQTSGEVKNRFKAHLYNAAKGSNTPVAKGLREAKLRGELLEARELWCVTEDRADEAERELIAQMKPPLNSTVGGMRGCTFTLSPEARKKIGDAKRGVPRTPEVRAKISATLSGRPIPAEVRAKMSAAHKGKKMSEEAKAKMRAAWVERKKRQANR